MSSFAVHLGGNCVLVLEKEAIFDSLLHDHLVVLITIDISLLRLNWRRRVSSGGSNNGIARSLLLDIAPIVYFWLGLRNWGLWQINLLEDIIPALIYELAAILEEKIAFLFESICENVDFIFGTNTWILTLLGSGNR